MTENEALAFDKLADAVAMIALCDQGPPDCAGREAQPTGPVFRKHPREYRQPDGLRLYTCQFCNVNHLFPVARGDESAEAVDKSERQ